MIELFWNYSDTVFPFVAFIILVSVSKVFDNFLLLFAYLLVTVMLMGYSNYLADQAINNMYLYHIYSLIEILIIVPFIGFYAKEDKRVIVLIIFLYCLFWIINIWLFERINAFNSISSAITALIISFFRFRYILHIAIGDDFLFFHRLPVFWIVSGFLFYCITAVIVIGSYKYKHFFHDLDTHVMWRIQQIANVLKYVLISIGIICSARRTIPVGL